MRAWLAVLALALLAGCRLYRDTGEVRDTIWCHFTPGEDWPELFAERYSQSYDPRGSGSYLHRAGTDGHVLLFATRVTSGGLFGGISGTAWRDRDVFGYAPTGRVGDDRTEHGREWREYRLLGGPTESPLVAEAISKQTFGRLDRPR